jgi:hypothetical protein
MVNGGLIGRNLIQLHYRNISHSNALVDLIVLHIGTQNRPLLDVLPYSLGG